MESKMTLAEINAIIKELKKQRLQLISTSKDQSLAAPFTRYKDTCYFSMKDGDICEWMEDGTPADDMRYSIANYCHDKEILTTRMKEEVLDRQIWRLAIQDDPSQTGELYLLHNGEVYDYNFFSLLGDYDEDTARIISHYSFASQDVAAQIVDCLNDGEQLPATLSELEGVFYHV